MYPVSLIYDKGLGDIAIYTRLLYGAGFWDFIALAESATDTADCRVYLSEIPTTSAVNSWYRGNVTLPPGGPYAVEIILLSTGAIIGDDLAEEDTASTSGGSGSTVTGITREQFAVKVLSVLGVYDKDAVDPEDQQNALDAYDAIYQELKDDGLVTWTQGGEGEVVPIRFLNSLISLTVATESLLGSYPQDGAATQRIMLGAIAANKRIRRQLASAQPTETVTVEYF